MAGIYLHIPFCRRKCHYCNFFSAASRRHLDRFPEAMARELCSRKEYLDGEPVHTLYFGGGTPSLLSPYDIQQLITSIAREYRVSEYPEITLETNPDDLTREYLRQLGSTSVNRISLGIQSFFDEDLALLNRIHTASQARSSLEYLLQEGFTNLSVDLIYGIPGLTDQRWRENLRILTDLRIPHISCYALTVEDHTALAWLISRRRMPGVEEEQVVRQYRILVEFLKEAGYGHYEVSNFCLPGMESRHNSGYWDGSPYLGAGPSAHSFNRTSRRWNHSNILSYVTDYTGQPGFEEEILTPVQQYNEYVMTGLRTSRGCSASIIRSRFGPEFEACFLERASGYLAAGEPGNSVRMVEENGVYRLTDEGLLFADGISADLFFPGPDEDL